MKLRTKIAAFAMTAIMPLSVVACGGSDTTISSSSPTSSASSGSTTDSSTDSTSTTDDDRPAGGGPGNTVDVSSVTTEAELVALVQEAYGDAGLDLHRGHQPVQDVLDEVLAISHDELHVRMEEQGQNLAAVATDLGIDPQTLVDALVESWSPAVDSLLEAGTITQDEADAYTAALEEAFTFRVTWDGEEATPTFSGIDA